jgi:colanic acid biosynthesis glycosyl transferase WcaI
MRLLVVSQYFWPEEFRINELVAELSARGHDITVITGWPNYPGGTIFGEFASEPDLFSRYAGAPVIRVPMLTRGLGRLRLVLNYLSFALSATIVSVLRFRNSRFDAILVFVASPVTVGVPAVVLRGLHGWPVAFWVLDQWPESLAAVGAVRSKYLLAAVGRLVRFLYSHCDLILSPSKRLVPQIARYCRLGQRIEYFPNWPEAFYGSASLEVADEVTDRAKEFTVMFAGNIGEAQDFPAILDAAEQVAKQGAKVRWLVVGDGSMASWVRAEIGRRGLEDRMMMLGRHPADRMPSFFRHADALLVALKSEPVFTLTAPGKIQSYLASGIPILAMLDGEGAALIEAAGAGLTSPAGDAKMLAENVIRLAALPAEERAAFAASGAAYAKREFDRTGLVDRLEIWLAEMITVRAGGSA